MHRPDPAKMAEKLFSQLDASGQGYIQKADLQSVFDKLSSASTGSSGSSTNVDDLFTSLDTDSDGKVTKQEFTDSLKKLQDSLECRPRRPRKETTRALRKMSCPASSRKSAAATAIVQA